ncbi:MAG: RNA-binding protein [Paracoccaceae bacterium]|nr:RNA-binding protein [Paracoccaceae bacterium]
MTRGGATRTRGGTKIGPERRCIATGESGPTGSLVRFVLGPGGQVVPDLAAKLPGRGVWLTADRNLVDRAVKKKLFSRAFRTQANAPADLAAALEEMIARRLIDLIGLARKAGQAVTGFEKVRARLKEGAAGVLFEAHDGAADGRQKLSRLAMASGAEVQIIDLLDSAELGLAFGRDFAIHAALDRGGFADRAIREAERLAGLRTHRLISDPADTQVSGGAARPASNDGYEGPDVASGQGDR